MKGETCFLALISKARYHSCAAAPAEQLPASHHLPDKGHLVYQMSSVSHLAQLKASHI